MRRRFRVRLRILMVMVFVCALGLAGFVLGVRRSRARRAAIAAVHASGGNIAYNDQWIPGGPNANLILWEPSPLRKAIGEIAFLDVIYVYWPRFLSTGPGGNIVPNPVTDDQAAVLKAFPRLAQVRIDDAPGITDKTLAHLAGVTELSQLYLARVNITDDGLANLKGLKRLERLGLSGVPITDRGLSHLAGLKIEQLSLSDCPIDGSGLSYLGSMPKLWWLDLRGVGVTDDSLVALQNIRSLRALTLIETKTTGRGMEHVGALQGLWNLWLGPENSSDERIARLTGLNSLATFH
jgi:hypothetical protein